MAYAGMVAQLMPYASIEQRKKTIDSAPIPDQFKEGLRKWAAEAPDLSLTPHELTLRMFKYYG